MSDTAPPQIGDTRKGHVFTANGWVPTDPPRKKRTFLKVFISLCAVGLVCVIGVVALVAAVATSAGKAIEESDSKPGGADNPMTIHEGKAFEVDGFDYVGGWRLADDGMGDATVKGLKVANHRDHKDSALVEIKLWKGTEVKALVDCTSDPIDPGTTVTLSCLGTDPMPRAFGRITINDSF